MSFTYSITKKGRHNIIALQGNLLDRESALKMLEEIDSIIADERSSFIIDFSGLHHLNSNGLNVLVTILTKARNAGGEVVVSNVPEKIKSLLVVTKLNTVFTVAENNKSAENTLKTVKE